MFGRAHHYGNLRADKLLSNRGLGSRTQVEGLFKRGLVFLMEDVSPPEDDDVSSGVPLKTGKSKVPPSSIILIKGMGLSRPIPPLLAFNKPLNVLTDVTSNDGLNRPSLSTHLPPSLPGYLPFTLRTYHPVGRLDYETGGLLLFSSEGGLTHRILGEKVWKRYRAVCKNREGFGVGGGKDEGERVRTMIEDSGVEIKDKGSGALFKGKLNSFTSTLSGEGSVIDLSVNTGVYRQVRRMLANVGHEVLELERVEVGGVKLGGLEAGEWRELEGEEVEWMEGVRGQQ